MLNLNSILIEGTVNFGIYPKSFWLTVEDETHDPFVIKVLHSIEIDLTAGQKVRVVGALTHDANVMQKAIKAEHVEKKYPFNPETFYESTPGDLFV